MTEIQEKMLKTLRENYAQIEKVDPTGPAWAKVKAFLGQRTDEELIAFIKADIKWISQASRCELIVNRDHDAADVYAI